MEETKAKRTWAYGYVTEMWQEMFFGTQEGISHLHPSHMSRQSTWRSFGVFTCSAMEIYYHCEKGESNDSSNDTSYIIDIMYSLYILSFINKIGTMASSDNHIEVSAFHIVRMGAVCICTWGVVHHMTDTSVLLWRSLLPITASSHRLRMQWSR